MAEAPVVAPVSRHTARVSAPPLDVKKGSDEKKLFKQMWMNYRIVARLTDDEEDYKRALFYILIVSLCPTVNINKVVPVIAAFLKLFPRVIRVRNITWWQRLDHTDVIDCFASCKHCE